MAAQNDTKSKVERQSSENKDMADSKGTNWTKIIFMTAAVVGVGAAAVYYLKKMKEGTSDVGGVIDDMVDFCKDKSAELDNLMRDLNTQLSS